MRPHAERFARGVGAGERSLLLFLAAVLVGFNEQPAGGHGATILELLVEVLAFQSDHNRVTGAARAFLDQDVVDDGLVVGEDGSSGQLITHQNPQVVLAPALGQQPGKFIKAGSVHIVLCRLVVLAVCLHLAGAPLNLRLTRETEVGTSNGKEDATGGTTIRGREGGDSGVRVARSRLRIDLVDLASDGHTPNQFGAGACDSVADHLGVRNLGAVLAVAVHGVGNVFGARRAVGDLVVDVEHRPEVVAGDGNGVTTMGVGAKGTNTGERVDLRGLV